MLPDDAASSLTLRLLGPFDARVNGAPLPRLHSRKGHWILALLALRSGREVERDWLAGILWPESPASAANAGLRNSLSDLRQALGTAAHRLRSPTSRTLALDTTAAAIDVLEFDAALARCDGEPWAKRLERAVALYRGPLLEGCVEEWAFEERQAREQAYLAARERLALLALEQGETAAAEQHLRLVVATDPLRESAQRALMQVLAASGSYAAALHCYRELRRHLHRELNAEPDAETQTLFQQLRGAARRLSAKSAGIRPTHPSLPRTRGGGPAQPDGPDNGLRGVPAADHPSAMGTRPDHRPDATRAPADVRPLPLPLTRFIGRARARADLRSLLLDRGVPGAAGAPCSSHLSCPARLVTLTGAGGCGKTRLALQIGVDLWGDYPDGVCWVDLAPVTDPNLVSPTVAAALGVRELPGRSLAATVAAALGSRSLLLLLDNCEHLLGACATLLQALLGGCPYLQVLATSRERLNLAGETTYRLPSLAVPEEGGVISLERLGQIEAVQLFLERAQATVPGFTLTAANAAAVARVCRRLDGIPLALELAAARLRMLTIEQISERLDHRFHLLTGGCRTALPRHQTLRALIDWSYQLLSPSEQALFRRLSVFAGGWTLEAAEAVCGGEVLDLLASLIDKSLVLVDEGSAGARYRFLESTRQYAEERLEATEARLLRRRHAEFFVTWAGPAETYLGVQWSRLDQELDNLRATLAWCREDPDGGPMGLRLLGALGLYWSVRGDSSEGLRWLVDALAHPGAADRTAERAVALFHAGNLTAWGRGDFAAARLLYEESLCIAREIGDPRLMIPPLRHLGGMAAQQGEFEIAQRLVGEAMALSRKAGEARTIALGYADLGLIAIARGEKEKACCLLDGSITLLRAAGDKLNAWVFLSRTRLAMEKGDLVTARSLAADALARSRELGNRSPTAWMLSILGRIATEEGEYAAAQAYWTESLTIRRDLGETENIPECLEGLAALAAATGVPERADRLWGASSALRAAGLPSVAEPSPAGAEPLLAAARAVLGDAAFAVAWQAGGALALDEAIGAALAEKKSRRCPDPALPGHSQPEGPW